MAQQETKFNTSFIPKKTASTPSRGGGNPYNKNGSSLFNTIGFFIFLISILAVAGVYGWEYKISNEIDTQIETLKKARSQFDERTIAEATRLNQRINTVKKLLDEHVAPSAIFYLLEDKTLQTVGLNNFQFETLENGMINITGNGFALSYDSVVLQSDELGNSDFRDVLFDNVQPDGQQNQINFALQAVIDKNLILYKNFIDQVFNENDNSNNEGEGTFESNSGENVVSDNNLFR